MNTRVKDRVRIGFVGAGSLANQMHYPSLAKMEDVDLVAVCDLVEEKAKATAARFGIPKTYSDVRKMVESEELDAVYIIAPPQHIFEPVSFCLKAGLGVFIEKPPGLTTFQTASFARMAAESGSLTMTGFNRRFIPMLRQTYNEITANGPIIQAVSTFYKHSTAVYYGGVIDAFTCDAIHAVDTLRWMCGGEVVSVTSMVSQVRSDVPNGWIALVRFSTGACGVLLTNWAVGARLHTFEMHGYGVSALLNPDLSGTLIRGNEERRLDPAEMAGVDPKDRAGYYGFYHESRHFIDCLKAGVQPETNFADALKTMQLVEAIYNSAVGGVVRL